jgi:ABC-2 type transport system permease protein
MALAEAHQLVQDGKLDGYIEFPDGFTSAVLAGRPATLRVFVHPDGQNTKAMLDSVAAAIAGEFDAHWVRVRSTTDLAIQFGGPEIGARLGEVLARAVEGRADTGAMNVAFTQVGPAVSKSATTFLLPGYVTMFVFFGLALSAEALVGERENQTLDRLIASRATRGSILLGKYLGNVGRGLIQAVILLGAGKLLFKVDLGYAPWATFAVTIAIVLCAAALGLAYATIARTKASANTIAVFASLIMAPLGGCWWPLWIMPHWMQNAAKIVPHAWANAAYAKLLYFAAPASSVVGEIAALLLFGAAFGAVAGLKFRISD